MPTKIVALVALLLTQTFFTRVAAAAAPAADADRIVVMISLDGLAGFYLDDPKAEMPTLRALAAEGARASSMKTSTPSVTWPTHTSLVTGVHPARHGVVGNNYYDRASGKRIVLIGDPDLDKEKIVKVPTIYDLAKAQGLVTAAIRWPAARNAHTLDWTIPSVKSDEHVLQYSTPALLKECREAGIATTDADLKAFAATQTTASQKDEKKLGTELLHPQQSSGSKPVAAPPAVDQRHPSDLDCTRAFNLILQRHRPNLALLHLVDIDHQQHLNGPRSPEAYAAIKASDARVREVWDELKRDYPGKATLLVVSDHGFSPIDRVILPNVVLRKAGLIEASGKKVTGGSVQIVVQGGSAMVYVTDEANRDKVVEQIQIAFKDIPGVSKVVGPTQLKDYGVADPKVDPNAPDMILFADEGSVFGDTASGDLPFNEKPERSGSHGHDPNLPDLHATFIAWGAGITPGAQLGEIQNIDVSPTIASLLGIPMPDVDGKPLAAALSAPAAAK